MTGIMAFLAWAGGIGVTSVAIIMVVWAGIKAFAAKWLDSAFSTKLEAVKLEGQKQLEDVKLGGQTQLEAVKVVGQSQIEGIKLVNAGSLDRVVKLNQREFEAIPDIWLKVTEAHFAVLRLIAIMQEGVDLSYINEAQFENFLSNSRLEEWQKDEIRGESSFARTTYYANASRWIQLRETDEAVVAATRALLGNSIFLHPDTFLRFEGFTEKFRDAFNSYSLNMRMGGDNRVGDRDPNEPINHYRTNGNDLYDDLGKYLRERYWINAQGEAV